MASICVHRAQQTPPGIAPGHICSRDDLQEEPQPATHSRQCPIPRFPAIHLTRQSPFYVPAGHIGSRDGIDLCPSSAANPSRHRSGVHSLARWFAGCSPQEEHRLVINDRTRHASLGLLPIVLPVVLLVVLCDSSATPLRLLILFLYLQYACFIFKYFPHVHYLCISHYCFQSTSGS